MPEAEARNCEEMTSPGNREFETVAKIISLLENLSKDDQHRAINTVLAWLDFGQGTTEGRVRPGASNAVPMGGIGFSDREEISPKQFLLEKEPHTDVERVACLAYYLTHYRDLRQFKTSDLNRLNTEAAQRGFSNAAYSTKNALRDGFLASAPKSGYRQLSAMGEQYVNALPDRDAASALRKRMMPKRGRRSKPGASARKRAGD